MNLFEWISHTKTFNNLDNSFSNQVSNLNPDTILILLNALLWLIIILVTAYWVVKIYKVWKSPDVDTIKKYKENLKNTSADSEQKSIILTLINQVNTEIKDIISFIDEGKSQKDIYEHGRKVIDLLTTQIPLSLKSTKRIYHRCAVFTIDDSNPTSLKVFEGCGYSLKGKEHLRLKIDESVAGKAFSNGEYKYIADVSRNKTFKPHPKATKQYFSLLCYPIKTGGNVMGVLSIDGSEKDCFSKDDIEYFKMFSNQIGIIIGLIDYNLKTEIDGGDKGGEIQNTG